MNDATQERAAEELAQLQTDYNAALMAVSLEMARVSRKRETHRLMTACADIERRKHQHIAELNRVYRMSNAPPMAIKSWGKRVRRWLACKINGGHGYV